MIYSSDDINWLRYLRVRAEVSAELGDWTPAHAMLRMSGEFIRSAQTRAIDVDSRDIQAASSDILDLPRMVRMVECWWEPATKEVTLVGGPGDGRLLEVQDIHRPLTIPVVHSFGPVFAADDETPLRSEVVTYRLSGWNTDSRRWLMSPAS